MHLMMNNFLMKSMSFAYSGFNRCHCTIVCRGFEIMSCQCFVSDAPEPFLPGGCKEKNVEFVFIPDYNPVPKHEWVPDYNLDRVESQKSKD